MADLNSAVCWKFTLPTIAIILFSIGCNIRPSSTTVFTATCTASVASSSSTSTKSSFRSDTWRSPTSSTTSNGTSRHSPTRGQLYLPQPVRLPRSATRRRRSTAFNLYALPSESAAQPSRLLSQVDHQLTGVHRYAQPHVLDCDAGISQQWRRDQLRYRRQPAL